MNNLRKFTTEAEYSAATLSYPAVSWVTSGDTLHYDLSGETPAVNDKVMVLATTEYASDGIILWNRGGTPNFTSITVNDTEVSNPNSTYSLDNVGIGTFLVKYGFNSTEIGDWFAGDIGAVVASEVYPIEVLIPSQITSIGGNYPSNASVIVCEATTPPTVEGLMSTFPNNISVYVPDSVVNDYKSDVGWGDMSPFIYPISEYSGNLPV